MDPGEKSDITAYTWDNRNRLIEVTHGETTVEYGYDLFERMVSRDDGGEDGPEYYVYDGENLALVLDLVGEQTVVNERYLFGPAVDQVLAVEYPTAPVEGIQGEGPVEWMLADNQGTVRDAVERVFSNGDWHTDSETQVRRLRECQRRALDGHAAAVHLYRPAL